MKKIVVVFLLFALSIPQLTAQIEDIKKKADKNKEENTGEHRDSRDRPPENPQNQSLSGACLDGLFEVCTSVCATVAVGIMIEHHEYQMNNRDINPMAASIDVMPHFSYSSQDGLVNYLPRIRGTWGVLSTDFRFNYLTETADFSAETYRCMEWQVLQLSFSAAEVFNFRIGTGIMYENYTENVYNEHSVAMEARFSQQKVLTTLEGRGTWDYETGNTVFLEANGRIAIRFININHVFGYLHAGYTYQSYYPSLPSGENEYNNTNFHFFNTGLTFNIH